MVTYSATPRYLMLLYELEPPAMARFTQVHTRVCVAEHACVRVCACTCVHVRMRVCACMRARDRVCVRACVHACSYPYRVSKLEHARDHAHTRSLVHM